MAYTALKPCEFAGQKFKIGEPIPEELILPGAAKNLVKMQIIAPAEASSAQPKSDKSPVYSVAIAVHTEEGDMPLKVTVVGLQQIFDILTSNVENAEKIIAEMDDGDALILLHLADGRKSVKAAAEARAKALHENPEDSEPEESAGEQ